ncbi:unknown protein [Waddlia chondrophila 2032/99]|uniref:Uncharacterized protein n=1 Tax=Waddlia chondrophila 2032/99 TaxID=765953 RepID=F8LC52_9BACT|nr:unknown protein [Waddlia chondrophila 2032/99]
MTFSFNRLGCFCFFSCLKKSLCYFQEWVGGN